MCYVSRLEELHEVARYYVYGSLKEIYRALSGVGKRVVCTMILNDRQNLMVVNQGFYSSTENRDQGSQEIAKLYVLLYYCTNRY